MAQKDFHHPFQPYDIQQRFMEAVYDCIENRRVGIFESPTGTGKSLSLICGSLTWLREHKRRAFDEAIASVQLDDDDPEWMIEQAKQARRLEITKLRRDLEERLQAVRERESKIRKRHANGEPAFKKRKTVNEDAGSELNDDEFMLDDYESEDEPNRKQIYNSRLSSETTKLMERVGMLQPPDGGRPMEVEEDELKIFFCSRTHSQLSQFVGELKRVRLPPAIPPQSPAKDGRTPTRQGTGLTHLTLGSRKNLCINSKVTRLQNPTAINERCVELQQSSTSSEQKCPYMPTKENEDLLLDFRDHALANVRDIEDLAAVGSKLQICPYYASRAAIAPAEIVTLPYPLLLQKTARQALGIDLKNHVVIIDEAHNLMNAIESIYSTQITESQLLRARASLMGYLSKFRNRLKGKNRVYVAQVVRVIDALLAHIAGVKSSTALGASIAPGEMLAGNAVDQINLSKLVRYIQESRLARKVESYTAHVEAARTTQNKTNTGGPQHKTDVPTLMHVQTFLATLMNPSQEGQFFWSKNYDQVVLKYLLLDPSEHFRDVVECARVVILAGGTMSPMDDYRSQLFPYLESIETLSCGHLIPHSSLLVRTIASDHHGAFDFSFKGRSSGDTASRIGQVVLELAGHVRGGLVVFFPSYSYLEEVTTTWRRQSIMQKLQAIRPVFSDSRGGSAEKTFELFSHAITNDIKCAVLLSVIGGKLSEGINFSDDLGRCVLVVGLPFPNLETPEWKAKMQHLEESAVGRGEQRGRAGSEHAENACMRSVNQAVGRVIRHKDDWASILLMDHRYTQGRIRSKLPSWIRECLPEKAATVAGEVVRDLEVFFTSKAG